jgi:septum formation protein
MKTKKKKSPQPRIVLASTSPRRIELMKQAGLRFETHSPDVDETPAKKEKPAALVARLSLAKAQSAMSLIRGKKGPTLIIAADTIVVEPQGARAPRILGKPRSQAEARAMLRKLQGTTHTVLTGYCILETDPNEREGFAHSHVRVVKSRVTMRPLSAAQIRAYVETGEPMDKAGSYGAQGIGMSLIDKIDGSFANVIGLPISQVIQDLEEHFDVRSFG